ncbi:MAG: AAA family ATPase [Deltaproteobacteria bacterium]|nr:AAA family ATPase [Deltaproteobacteria bacterium]MBN2673662.1 AAA family ATPase [Deltaproteobacteria bacterium]
MKSNQLKSIKIEHLRGSVTPFTIPFENNKKLTIVYGENGTGKSSICDGFDFIANGRVGSLDEKGLSRTEKYWPSLGKGTNDISVTLATKDYISKATLSKTTPIWSPPSPKPIVEILRRTQILKLVEARAGDRYKEIERFIDVSKIENTEAALKRLIDDLKREQNDHSQQIQGSLNSLKEMCPIPDEVSNIADWAQQEVDKDFTATNEELARLNVLSTNFTRLNTHVGKLENFVRAISEAKGNVSAANTALQYASNKVSDGAADLVDILESAKRFLMISPNPSVCPLCESPAGVEGLQARVDSRIETLNSLKTAKWGLENAKQKLLLAQAEPEKLLRAFHSDRGLFLSSLTNGVWSTHIEIPSPCPDTIEEFEKWYKTFKALPDAWRAYKERNVAEQHRINELKKALNAYKKALLLPSENSILIPRIEKMYDLIQEERKKFTDEILSDIATEVGRLYESVHPGEGRDKISLELDPKKRASLDLAVEIAGQSGHPPQAYFSESHMDTLGLCVFFALARKDSPENRILIIDDVLASVDEPHVERLIEMLYRESQSFQHCILTTHYKPWREKYHWGQLREGYCQFIELGKWNDVAGISILKNTAVSEVERLELALQEQPPDYQVICSKAGVILEAILNFITKAYQCAVPRKDDDLYTINDLLQAVSGKLRSSLRVEKLISHEPVQYEDYPLGSILDDLSRISGARNAFGAHFKEISFSLMGDDSIKFATKVLELADLLIDREWGWPTIKSSGSYRATKKETRRLHPFVKPS